MQLHKTMRRAGVSLSAAALALLTAEGPAAAHELTFSQDLRGGVTSVASGDFVLQKHDGTTQTVDTADATTYSEPGSSVAPPGVYDGENVTVFPEKVSGRVTNVAGSTVTLTNKRGTDTVIVSPSTKYYEKGATPTAVSDGEVVTVFGLPDPGTPGELDRAGRRRLQSGDSAAATSAGAATDPAHDGRRHAVATRGGSRGATPRTARPGTRRDRRELVDPERAVGAPRSVGWSRHFGGRRPPRRR